MGEYINSTTSRFDRSLISCGVVELHHIPENTRQVPFSIATYLYHKANPRPGAFVVFSDVVDGDKESRGAKVAELLENMKVGSVIASSRQVNPRTGNVIQVWLFTPDHEAFRKWYQDELANRITE